jgi:hypothetical protein
MAEAPISATPETPTGVPLAQPRLTAPWQPEPFIARKVSDGLSVRVVCPDGDVSAQGEFHFYDGFFGFNLTRPKLDPTGDVAIILQIEQAEYETNQIDAAGTFAAGAKVFFTPGSGTTPGVLHDGAGTHYVGIVTVEKDASGAIWMHLAAQGTTGGA